MFFLTEEELGKLLEGNDNQAKFALYMAARNFNDYGYYIFKEHDFNMFTNLPNDREVNGCKNLYDVLIRKPFLMKEDGELFMFITGSIVSHRELKEGELL